MNIPLYEQVYSSILDDIRSGKLKRGERIPSEKELAEQFDVSRITTKKALELLSQADIIQRIRGKGSYVSDVLPNVSHLESELDHHPETSHITKDNKKIIGLVIPDFSDAFGTKMVGSIEENCSKKNSHLIIKGTYGKIDEERRAIQSLIKLRVDGLIVFPVHGEHYNTTLLQLVIDGYPLVLVDRYLKGIPACSIYTDNKKGAGELTTYLLGQGHRDIAFLSPPEQNTSTIEDRIQGFSMALSQHGLRFNPNYLLTDLFSTLPMSLSNDKVNHDKKTLRDFIHNHPQLTAFVACEYNLANILSQVLNEERHADEYEIVCFDSLYDSLGAPMYTHIHQNEALIGETAVKLLLSQIKGDKVPLNSVIDYHFVKKD